MTIQDMSPEAYSGLWGCDPCYDTPPRIPGDGYVMYNAGSELQKKDVKFLESWQGAVDRTLQQVEQDPEGHEPDDLQDLKDLLVYVTRLLMKEIEHEKENETDSVAD